MNRETAWLAYQSRMIKAGRTPHEADFLAGWIAGQAEAEEVLSEVNTEFRKMVKTTKATFAELLAELRAVIGG
jgi:hypothetical protein